MSEAANIDYSEDDNSIDTLKPSREWVESIKDLPTLPAIAAQVVELMDDPGTTASQLGRVISADQGLAMQVLKIANSAYYGFPRRIGTIDLAIVVLGFDALKSLTLSLSIREVVARWKSEVTFDFVEYWKHCMYTGIAARMLARICGYRVPGEAFIAGVVHDVGKAALSRYFPDLFAQTLQLAEAELKPLHRVEEELMGVNHGEIGGWLCDQWKLPARIVEAVTHHHRPDESQEYRLLTALVNLSDWLVLNKEIGWSGEVVLDEVNDFSWNTLRLRRLEDGSPDLKHYLNIFDIEVEKSDSFVEMLIFGESADDQRKK